MSERLRDRVRWHLDKGVARITLARPRHAAEQLDEESATIARLSAAPDGREGVDAFLAKRPAVFGRSTA